MTGGELLDECASVEKPGFDLTEKQKLHQSWCLSYIQGITEGLLIYGGSCRPGLICLPEHYNYLQMARVVVKYLHAHPESHHLGAVVLIPLAYQKDFPCETRK